MNTFFTADTHFDHSNIIPACERPFISIMDMNETIIKNWNEKIGPKDRIYHLGDYAFANRPRILQLNNRLNGHIILIEGNHDKIGDPKNYGFSEKHKLLEIKIDKIPITLCHYSMRVWNKSHFGAWHLYGHSHTTLEPVGLSWDVGVDNNNFTPIEFEELRKKMENRPENLNWLNRLPGYIQAEFDKAKALEME